ncbi:hypothetical protein ISG33_11150 [Glaciecola sp. MH2013]|uniref:hypothetical protein n=1 Tax=Glaciecola sp. MH2013 TaxID=2785524 RepID=UPI0018A0D29D|nr:hypothetical protein [Glaciecola sp. MH2013]MBF7073956.1 hypothetical protein [Glaciecola sp. MH2013]
MSHFNYKENGALGRYQLTVEKGLDDESLAEILKGNYKGLWLLRGDFTALAAHTDALQGIEVLRISTEITQDISWVSDLPNLTHLSVEGKTKGFVDFNALVNLSSACIEYSNATKNLVTSNAPLKGLLLSKWKAPLTEFSDSLVASLTSINLTSGNHTSIEGLRRFKNLTGLVLFDIRKITDISELEYCPQIEELDISCCNRVEGVEVIKYLHQLRRLIFENKSLPSLSLVPRDNLEEILLGDSTTVEDYNIECLLDFPKLQSVSYSKRKAYKYAAVELQAMLTENK